MTLWTEIWTVARCHLLLQYWRINSDSFRKKESYNLLSVIKRIYLFSFKNASIYTLYKKLIQLNVYFYIKERHLIQTLILMLESIY